MRISIRRTTVSFSSLFYDENGELTIPESATLTIDYPLDGWPLDGSDLSTVTVDMDIDADGVGTYDWDSSVSSPGIIYWHTEGGAVSQDGHFRLRGNFANLEFTNT